MNKCFCVAITFLQYVKLGLKEFFSDPKPSPKKGFWVNLRDTLLGALAGLVIGFFLVWLVKVFNISVEAFAKAFLWFIGIAAVIDLIALLVFLFVSWRKAVRDCWDKFQAG